MKKFINLLKFELNQGRNVFLFIASTVTLFQIGAFVYKIIDFKQDFLTGPQSTHMGVFSVSYYALEHIAPTFTVILAAVSLLTYAVYSWEKEWRGQGKFIYRLLMLPGNRMSIYFAKLFSILIFMFALLGLQIVILQFEIHLAQMLLPIERVSHGGNWINLLNNSRWVINIIIQPVFARFLAVYSGGILFLVSVYQLILLNASNRATYFIKKIMMNVGYIILSMMAINSFGVFPFRLTIVEGTVFFLTYVWILIVANILFSYYLINKKVSI